MEVPAVDQQKKQKVLIAVLAVAALGAGSVYYFMREDTDGPAASAQSGPAVRRERADAKEGTATTAKRAERKATDAPKATTAERRTATRSTETRTAERRSATGERRAKKKAEKLMPAG